MHVNYKVLFLRADWYYYYYEMYDLKINPASFYQMLKTKNKKRSLFSRKLVMYSNIFLNYFIGVQ